MSKIKYIRIFKKVYDKNNAKITTAELHIIYSAVYVMQV